MVKIIIHYDKLEEILAKEVANSLKENFYRFHFGAKTSFLKSLVFTKITEAISSIEGLSLYDIDIKTQVIKNTKTGNKFISYHTDKVEFLIDFDNPTKILVHLPEKLSVRDLGMIYSRLRMKNSELILNTQDIGFYKFLKLISSSEFK